MSLLLLVPIVFTLACWLFSLRRTPFALGWLVISTALMGSGVLVVGAVESVHHTLPGLIAGLLAGCVLPAVTTACVEGIAMEAPGTTASDIALWRKNHRRRGAPAGSRWSVVTRSQKEDDSGKETVWLGVRNGQRTRWIGEADPLTDMDAFMELRVKADQAAETLNALKIGQ